MMIFVTGPAGCGKTTNAHKLAQYFHADIVIDGDSAADIQRALNAVYGIALITTTMPEEVIWQAFPKAKVLQFDQAMRMANLALPAQRAADVYLGGMKVRGAAEEMQPGEAEKKAKQFDALVAMIRNTDKCGDPLVGTYISTRHLLDFISGMPAVQSKAITDVARERSRQQNTKGYTRQRDAGYKNNELVRAAIAYSTNVAEPRETVEVPYSWPWEAQLFNPEGRRIDLIKAAALLVAEIERLDLDAEEDGDL